MCRRSPKGIVAATEKAMRVPAMIRVAAADVGKGIATADAVANCIASGDSPLQCDDCGKEFIYPSS